ncbi:MAG: type I DNA topoisomerase [Bacteroidetes bacterium]|nr:type I DNA topoisomerase [Bacteroidota bacterium]MDE2671873.1 type I DNA topoisomerase [Bacteroidota bacterium]
MSSLVIVESPTKARTIGRFLPSSKYRIMASLGHVRDLPNGIRQVPAKYKKEAWASIAVRLEDGKFKPFYIIPPDKRKVVKELKDALAGADRLLIATDEDREGEAIGWHLIEVLKPKVPVHRMVFHEITKEAIQRALENTRAMDLDLVEAQESRRVLDRLVGYKISPVLWRKIGRGTSAGRVQSVAVRLLVLREKERMAFIPAQYWDLAATLQADTGQFTAVMTHLGERRLAIGRDFDDNTGQLKESLKDSGILLLSKQQGERLVARLPSAHWSVTSVEHKVRSRKPAAPFITSSLQQEASRKLRWVAKKTMRVAQRLYERGFITYMRTDSVTLSKEALQGVRHVIQRRYGAENLSSHVRRYKSKVSNAQEAHEAIRPAGRDMKTAAELRLSGDEYKLYDLIWKRTVASQMVDARVRDTRVISTATLSNSEPVHFRAAGSEVLFKGFLQVYAEGTDESEATKKDAAQRLPALREQQPLRCLNIESKSHETKPPARYTEASLIKKLEEKGIGRPSTYATIISTIQDRGSAILSGRTLGPTLRAFATTALMEERFDSFVDIGFTAQMEKRLDEIAQGKEDGQAFLYSIDQGKEGIQKLVEDALNQADAREISTITSPKWSQCVVRVGRYGPYVQATVDGREVRSGIPDSLLPADLSEEQLLSLLTAAQTPAERLGVHPESGKPILLKNGKYGAYLEISEPEGSKTKPQRKSIPKHVKVEDVDLELALDLLRFPITLGKDPDSGEVIYFDNGRYGPFVKRGKLNASIKGKRDLGQVTLEEAIKLLNEKATRPRTVRRRRKKA